MNRYRKYITTSVGFSFLAVGATGMMFQFLFKNHLLVEIHGWLGVLMVALAIFHIAQNWKPLKSYLRDRRVLLSIVPMLLVALFLFFDSGERNKLHPREVVNKLAFGRAKELAAIFGKDLGQISFSMREEGIQLEGPEETIIEVARKHKRSPEQILKFFVR